MAGRQRIGAQIARGRQKVGKFDRLVAGNAGDRRFAGNIAFGEGIDHRFAETLFVVENIMRDAQHLADAAGIIDILAGTARTSTVHGSAMVVKLQGNTENVIALAFEDAGDHGTIDTAGHGDDDTRVFGLAIKIETVHGIQSGLLACQ